MTFDPNTSDALQQMARHVAAQLVADALKGMIGGVTSVPVTVTLHPQTARRLLPPAPVEKRRGRTPGPKPKKAGGRPKWTAAQHAKFSQTMAARRGTPPTKPKGTIGRPRKVTPPAEARCTRCDHTVGEHDASGKCLSFRCVCTGLWR